jgi:3-oxoacyl-[acyl-carrier-protein] synthase II
LSALAVTIEIWITGGGMISALGDGDEAQWQGLGRAAAGQLAIDSRSFPPFHVFPVRDLDLDRYIPRKGDQRAMGPLMQYGVCAAGLALAEAGIAGNAALLGQTHLIAAVGGGERDEAVDEQIMTVMMGESAGPALLNEQLSNNLRPTLFLAQLPNLFAANIAIVHGLVGASRTFMGEESAGVDAARIAFERLGAGQGELFLVGGACSGSRKDLMSVYHAGGVLLTGPVGDLWDRPKAGICLGSVGAFLVMETRAHAERRGARPLARLAAVFSDRCRRLPGAAAANAERQWRALAPRIADHPLAVISGACGSGPITREEHDFLGGLAAGGMAVAVRGTAAAIGHSMEASFLANLFLAISCIRRRRLFAPLTAGEPLERRLEDGTVDRVLVTGWGHQRGEGMAYLEAVG